MNKQLSKEKETQLRWKNYGDFSVHYGKGVAVINNRSKKTWVEIQRKEENDWFNSYQYFLFRRCLYGLDVYSQEEMRYISSQKKKRILKVHRHSLDIINLFKQRIVVDYTNQMLDKLFPNSPDAKLFISSCSEIDPDFQCTIPLEQLNITRKDIARELVSKKCLPYNFFELTIHDDPRMIKLKRPQEAIDAL